MQDLIAELKKNNFKVKQGEEGDVILALAQYAAQDSNLTNDQIGDNGKLVAEITSKLIKANPNIKSIIKSVIPETKKELQECRNFDKQKLLEAKQWTAKKFLAGLLILLSAAIAAPGLSAAGATDASISNETSVASYNFNNESYKQMQQNQSSIDLNNQDFSIDYEYLTATPFVRDDGWSAEQNFEGAHSLDVVANFVSIVSFKTADGAEGTIKFTISNLMSFDKFWTKGVEENENTTISIDSVSISETYVWSTDYEVLECNKLMSKEAYRSIYYDLCDSDITITPERINEFENILGSEYDEKITSYFYNADMTPYNPVQEK